MREASFSIAIVTEEEKDVWVHGVQQLAPEQALLGLGVQSWNGVTHSPPASPTPTGEQTGHMLQGAPINLYAKIHKPLQGLGQTFSKVQNICPAVLLSLALSRDTREGPSVAPGTRS